jgi:hypothetical protein
MAIAPFFPVIPHDFAGNRIVDNFAIKRRAFGDHTRAAQQRSGNFDFGESL